MEDSTVPTYEWIACEARRLMDSPECLMTNRWDLDHGVDVDGNAVNETWVDGKAYYNNRWTVYVKPTNRGACNENN